MLKKLLERWNKNMETKETQEQQYQTDHKIIEHFVGQKIEGELVCGINFVFARLCERIEVLNHENQAIMENLCWVNDILEILSIESKEKDISGYMDQNQRKTTRTR